MKIDEWAKELLFGESIEQKLTTLERLDIESLKKDNSYIDFSLPETPGRNKQLRISQKAQKFPKNFSSELSRAHALHFFANHELLAIEMMAAALLMYPNDSDELIKVKKGIISALKDEQKHLKLYIERMNELGVGFGDLNLGGFFWSKMKDLTTPAKYLSAMALTFEAANLDFASYYRDMFLSVEDQTSSDIMQIILDDEISHVALGNYWLSQWKKDKSLWEYYLTELPYPLTPARSKGMIFNREARLKAGLNDEFLNEVFHFDDQYNITKRKEWKS